MGRDAPMPWAQGVGHSNLAAPTKETSPLFAMPAFGPD